MLVRPRMLSDNHRGQKKPTNLCFFRFEDSPKGFHGQWVIQVEEEVRNLLLNDSGKKMFARSPAREYKDVGPQAASQPDRRHVSISPIY